MRRSGLVAREWLATALCWNDRLYRALDRAIGTRSGGMILAFHDLPTESFVAQVSALGRDRIISLDELVMRLDAGRSTAGLCALTFDDGVGSVTRQVAAMAVRHELPVTCYLPTGYLDDPDALAFQTWGRISAVLPRLEIRLGGRILDLRTERGCAAFVAETTQQLYVRREEELRPFLRELADYLVEHGHATRDALRPPAPIAWEEVATLSRNPLIRFESHGVSHRAMTGLDVDEAERELQASKRAIEERTGVPCRHFCYPYGSLASIGTAAPALARKHYASAVTMVRGRIGNQDRALLPRVPLYARDTGHVARLKAITAR